MENKEQIQNFLIEAKEYLKNWIKPHLIWILETKFDENFKNMIAYGYWYKPIFIEKESVKKIEKRLNENGEEIEVEVFDFIDKEVQNPQLPADYIACIWFDKLFDDSILAIENYQKNIFLPGMLAEAIKKVEV